MFVRRLLICKEVPVGRLYKQVTEIKPCEPDELLLLKKNMPLN